MGIALPQVVTEDRASGAQVIDGSLTLQRANANYLTRAIGTAGNRRTWTYSCWIKRDAFPAAARQLWGQVATAGASATGAWQLYYAANEALEIHTYSLTHLKTNAVYRDTGWYHVVQTLDTTSGTADNRVRLYINGVEQTSFATRNNPNQNLELGVNTVGNMVIGTADNAKSTYYIDAKMAQIYFIDGQALGPEYFGYTDPLTNTWRPRKVKTSGPNDGRTWTSTATISSGGAAGGKPLSNGFDGSISNAFEGDTSGATVTVPVSATIVKGGVKVYAAVTSGAPLVVLLKNGGTTVETINAGASGGQFYSSSTYSGPITSLVISRTGRAPEFNAIGINGIILKDGSTTNLDFGTNGFYLPMDGNSPIGEDKSGKGNNWTPVNFGGSVALPKATGAKPILNTDGGGNTARVGVFGSEVGAQYTTTSATNSGGKYVFENEGTQPTFSFIRGATYTFDYNASTGHPLRFATAADAAGSTQYTDGTNTSVSNVISFTVPHNAPNTLHYYCTNHSGMGNSISVTTDETKADPYAWKNVLALPLIDNGAGGTTQDFSNQINAGSTTKASTTTGSTDSTSAQSVFYNRSFVLDGNGDDIRVPDDADFTFGSGDFTLECWAHQTANSSWRSLMMKYDSTESNASWYWALNTGVNNFYFYYSGANSKLMQKTSNTAILLNTWVHFAITRSGNVFRMFENGIQVGTMTESVTNNDGTIRFTVGADGNQNYDFAGYFSDVRVYKGVAKYTSNFIPASTNPDILPDTPSGVSGGSKLTKVTDGAVSFDGSSDSLKAPDSSDLAFGTGEFTVEMFFYANTVSGNDVLYDSRAATGSPADGFSIVRNSNQLRTYTSGAYKITPSTFRVVSYRWYHLAITRESTTQKMYIDGELVGSATVSNDFSQQKATIGSDVGTGESWDGFISNVRLIKGTALYTSNFTPPTSPLTNVTNTKLLCCQSNTSATEGAVIPNDSAELNAPLSSVAFADSSTRSKTITNVGSITTASAGSNTFNITNAASFDGSSKRLNLPQTGMTFTGSFTLDTYIKLDSSASNYNAIINTGYQTGSDQYVYIGVDNNDRLYLEDPTTSRTTASGAISKNTWYHIRVTQGDGNMKLYANGTLQVTHATNTVNMVTGRNFTIGSLLSTGNNSNNFHGLIGPTRYVATNLGAPSAGGEATTGGALSNLSFAGSITANGDTSATNFNPFTTDINTVRGQETGYATLNPLNLHNTSDTLSEGNLKLTSSGSGSAHISVSTLSMTSGKYFCEVKWIDVGQNFCGLRGSNDINYNNSYIYLSNAKASDTNGSSEDASYGATWTTGDTIGVAYDADNKTLEFFKNGVSQGVAFTSITGTYDPNPTAYQFFFGNWSSQNATYVVNFGQKPFKFPPPQGFLPLNSASVTPETVIVRPDQYVDVRSGLSAQFTISDLNFETNLMIAKSTSNDEYWIWADSVRGFIGGLRSNDTNAQGSGLAIANVNSNGYQSDSNWFTNGRTYVTYSFKAGGNKNTFNVDDVGYASAAAAGLDSGSINPTGASVGTRQGFSIIQFTNTTSNSTQSHGLTQKPDFIIWKKTSGTSHWPIYHSSLGATKFMYLNLNNAASTGSEFWNNTEPTSSVVTTKGEPNSMGSAGDTIMYLWHDVPGLQKFGTYEGNGSTDGPYVELGFKPAFLMLKNYDDTEHWYIYDLERSKTNVAYQSLQASSSGAEETGTTNTRVDILSNGFKLRQTNGPNNSNSYIYMAWAAAPSFNLYGAQSNAR